MSMQPTHPDRRPAALLAVLASTLAVLAATTAQAHVVFTEKTAAVGTYHRTRLVIGHGCEGSSTVAVQVDIPDGIAVARPQPKPGWTVKTETGPLASPATVHGKTVTEGVRRVVWRGGPLPDSQFDEFGLMLMPQTAGTLHFRVLQTCERGAIDWSEVPGAGGGHLKAPTAVLEVVDPAAADSHAGHPMHDHPHDHDHTDHGHH